MVLLKSNPGSIDSEMVDFSLKGIDGVIHSQEDYKDFSLLVVISKMEKIK